MSSVYEQMPLNIDVTQSVDSLHVSKFVTRLIFSNITERHVTLALSAPLNGFIKLNLNAGFTELCLCEPAILRESITANTAFKKLLIHTLSDEVQLDILPNAQHPVCTLYVQVSFTDSPPSLKNLAKTIVRANTLTNGHGSLAVKYFRYIHSDYNLCENVGEQMYKAKISLTTNYGVFPTCNHTFCECIPHCQICKEKAHCCTTGNVAACTGVQDSSVTHNVLTFTLFNS
jgi:hypothetical protein